MQVAKQLQKGLISVVLTALLFGATGCAGGSQTVLVSDSPNHANTLRILHRHSFSCGSDGCLRIEVVSKNRQTLLYESGGWIGCFAAASWSVESRYVSFVAADCGGAGAVGMTYDVLNNRRLPLIESGDLLRNRIRQEFGVDTGEDVLQWASDYANIQSAVTNRPAEHTPIKIK
jgi:hypothetical protein